MTMTKRGEPGGPEGWERPSLAQRRHQPSSKEERSNVFRSRFESSAVSVARGILGIKKGLWRPFLYQKPDLPFRLLDAGLQLLDSLLDDDLGHVRDDLPRDLPNDAI